VNVFVVSALAADGTGLQTVPLARVRAADVPVLCYSLADFPDTLELSLVFRRADAPDDLGTVSIPAPGSGVACVDLSTYADWRGEITELGFAEYATAQLVPPSVAANFPPFRIEGVQLQSPSWSQVFARVRSDWFGYRPWALLSISALGPQIFSLQNSWMQLVVVLGLLFSLAATWVILRWPRQRIALAAVFAAIGAWVLLDLRWLDDFVAKHRVIERLYAGKPWDERRALQPDEDTLAAAREVSRLAQEQGVKRVLVLSDSTYTLLRFIYFLLPLNTAPMAQALGETPGAPPPRDALIAVFGSEWNYDKAAGTLGNGTVAYRVAPVYAKGDLRVFRARETTP